MTPEERTKAEGQTFGELLADTVRIAYRAAAEEMREACARLAESMDDPHRESYDVPSPADVAAAIRALPVPLPEGEDR